MTAVRDETRSIEVMHVITAFDVGGAETVLTRLVAGDKAGPISHRVVSLKPGGALRARLEADGVPIRDLGIERNSDAPGGLAGLTAAIRDARRRRWYIAGSITPISWRRSRSRSRAGGGGRAWSGGSGARAWTCTSTRAAPVSS